MDSMVKAQECYWEVTLESTLEKRSEEGQQRVGPARNGGRSTVAGKFTASLGPVASLSERCCCAAQGSSAGCTELSMQSLPVPVPVLDGMTHCCGS